MRKHEDEIIRIGHIIGAQGINGWVKVFSDTSPRENILNYSPWKIQMGDRLETVGFHGRLQGKNVVAKLAGIEDREAASQLSGSKICILAQQLPKLDKGEYYWSDLIGLEVESLKAEPLGTIESMMETGANDVMVLQGDRERLIPFVMEDVVKDIDLDNRRLVVDWKPDY